MSYVSSVQTASNMDQEELQLLLFPNTMHAEIGLGDSLRYYVGGEDVNEGKRFVSAAINRVVEGRSESPLVVIKLPMTERLENIEEELKKNPPGLFNTCMGSAANIINRFSKFKIPFLVRQLPEFAGSYLILRSLFSSEVKVEFYASKSRIVGLFLHNMALQTALIGMPLLFIQSLINSFG